MSSDLYRDYSNEILQRPLPKLEPPGHIFEKTEDLNSKIAMEQKATSSASTRINVHQSISPPSGNNMDRKQQWRANVNSAISGNFFKFYFS